MICIPIVGPSMTKALEDIPLAETIADILELRIDLIHEPDLPGLLGAASKPCIVTNRTKLEGGQFRGSEPERVGWLQQAIDLNADYIDIEVSTAKDLLKPVLEAEKKTRVILSYHDFTKTPEDLNPLYETLREFPSDIIKIVTYAKDINDNLTLFEILKRAKAENRKLIGLCMGEYGEISRVLSPLFGGFLTFGSLETGKESAPGQILASVLRNVYRLGDRREDFNIYGVIGNPVSKSMGYLIHNRGFQEIGSQDIYVSFLVRQVEKFYHSFQEIFAGLSVTMPYKENLLKLVDAVDETAAKIGAINTVVKEDGKWKGYNTDCIGAVQALESRIALKDKRVLILGSGGTAKAIGHGVAERGGKVTVTYNRNKERGLQLAKELNGEAISIRDVGDRPVDALINCSPVGMSPNVGETPYPARNFKKGMVVFDSVYNPAETRLLKEAKEAGCETISGIELFLNQAVAQFELWTRQKAPREAMRQALLEKLQTDGVQI